MKPRVLLFGGAFDPPHIGHSTIVKEVLKLGICDQVRIVPVGQHAFDKKMSSSADRLEMVNRAFDFTLPIRVEKYELLQTGVSFTSDTLQHLKQTYPELHFSLLIGADNVTHFDQWHDYQDVMNENQVYVYPRPTVSAAQLIKLQKKFPTMIFLEHVSKIAVQSTEIRSLVRQNAVFDTLVGDGVLKYIFAQQLYH